MMRLQTGNLAFAPLIGPFLVFLSVRPLASANERSRNLLGQETYGTDVSYPMQHSSVSTNYEWLVHNIDPDTNPIPDEYKGMPVTPFRDRQKFHEDHMQGCRIAYGQPKGGSCDANENARIAQGLRQPQAMKNYTQMGFAKVKAPEEAFKHIKEFWENNKMSQVPEQWAKGYTLTNHWESPSTNVRMENSTLVGGGLELKRKVWKAAHTTLEQWTGQKLTSCFMYGIRVYHTDSILATHVDRLPLVSSAIINVAQDVDEPWPLEVIGHDGNAYNVTLEPGEMVLYESHSVLHGRPFPLKGRFYANVFLHFEPLGEALDGPPGESHHRELIQKLLQNNSEDALPPYLIPGSEQESFWRERNPEGWKPALFGIVSDAKEAAHSGDVESLKEVIASNFQEVEKPDGNGWQAIHMAAQGGHLNAVQLLAENGVDINSLAGGEKSPLDIAKEFHGPDHPVVEFLVSRGALDVNPKAAKDAVYLGDVQLLQKLIASDKNHLHKKDPNGWQLIHEASRGGHPRVIELLAKHGADLNMLTSDGSTPLSIAKKKHGLDHPIIESLASLGACDSGP